MWWRLSLPVQPELEESLLWKLNALGLHRVAVQHAPETPDQRTLLAWLPAHEWPEDQRHQLLASLAPLADTFGLALAVPQWDELADEDWSRSWKQHWQPDPVGRGMLILPAWMCCLFPGLVISACVFQWPTAVVDKPGDAMGAFSQSVDFIRNDFIGHTGMVAVLTFALMLGSLFYYIPAVLIFPFAVLTTAHMYRLRVPRLAEE